MRNHLRALALIAAALCWPSARTAAQTQSAQPGTQPPSSRPPIIRQPLHAPLPDPRARSDRPGMLDGGLEDVASLYQDTLDFARCMQRSRPQRLATLLEKPLSSRAEELAADRLLRFSGSCPGGRLKISARMLRGAAAEAILENFAAAAPDKVTRINTAQVSDFAAASPPVDRVRDHVSQDVQTFVECQVVLAPGLARKLINARPGSPEADDAAQELIGATALCGSFHTDGGPTQIAYRSYLAEALYHWTRATASHRLS